MKMRKRGGFIILGFAAALGLLSLVNSVEAHPYASGITNVSGTIYFVLNESNSAVTITLTNNGSGLGTTLTASAATSSLPSTVGTNVGTQFFSMTQGATTYTNYSIKVTKAGNGVVSQISSDANTNNMFYGPRGVGVNQNPQNQYFGRIYISEANAGSTVIGGVAGTGRTTVGRGFYVLNADQSDVLNHGLTAQAAGVTWTTASGGLTYSPFKCFVGPDDNLYACDAMTNACTIWQVNPDITTSTQVLGGLGLTVPPANATNSGTTGTVHGRATTKPYVTGTTATSDLTLYTIDTDLASPNHIQKYNIGALPLPYNSAPTQLGDTGLGQGLYLLDLAYTGSNFYVSCFRTVDNDGVPNLKIYDATGMTVVWDSLSTSLNPGHDPFVLTEGMSVSPDGNFLATERQDNSICVVRLTNGIPDLTTLVTNVSAILATTGRAASWDAADNLYIASGGVDRLRVFSMGLSSTAITSGDTTGVGVNNHGTFQFVIPVTTVSVTATTPLASQNYGSPIPGVFTFTRAGQNLNQPLTVTFTVGGTATNGADYTFSPVVTTNLTFAANQTTTNLTVNPVEDSIPRLTNTVVATVQNSTTYALGTPATATVFIQNTGPQLLKIGAVQSSSMYKPFPNDYGSFTIVRYGDASQSYTVTNFALSGTAAVSVDFAPPTVDISSGSVTNTVGVFPLVSATAYTGNKTVTIGLANDPNAGPGYTTMTNTVNLTIIDNAYPAESILYSNSLNDPDDAPNWTVTFASTNDPLNLTPDYSVIFGQSVSDFGLGTPPNGLPNAMLITCNKQGLKSSCGVNVYLNTQSFSGDYAVRFNMSLVQGTAVPTSTEGALFGINHSGAASNWWGGDITAPGYTGPWASDGVWWWVDSDPGGAAAGDVLEYTGTNNVYPNTGWQRQAAVVRTSFPYAFKNVPLAPAVSAPYTCVGNVGLPANNGLNAETTWSDVEMKQVKNIVTMSINKIPITVFTNATIWNNGRIMLGYDDPFASIGTVGAVYYSNLRVVRLGPPSITGVAAPGASVNVAFVSLDGDDSATSFALQSASNVTGPYTDVSATITQPSQSLAFQAVTAKSGNAQFYRIRHK